MPTLAEVRQQYPQYNDMSDTALADALHGKFYSDMPRDEFNKKIGFATEPEEQSAIGKVWSAIAERFTNPPNELSLIGTAGKIYKAFTDPIPQYGDRQAMVERGTDIALSGSPISAGSVLKRLPVSPVAPKAAVPTTTELKAAATRGYESPEVAAVEIKAPAIQQWATDLKTKLTEAGLDENVAKTTWGILSKIDKVPPEAFATGKNLDSLRKTLGNAAGSNDASERRAAVQAISSLDEFLPNVKQADVIAGEPAAAAATLETARGNWSAAKHAELLDKKQFRAELRAAAANSGQNVSNTIRQRIADVLINDKERKGFSQAELELMKRIVEGSRAQNAIRTAGNVMGGGGGIAAGGFGVAGALSNPAFAAVPIIGWGLKKLSNTLAVRDVGKLNELVRSNSPLGRQMAKPLEDWSAKAQAFEVSPTVRNFATLSIAARNLATNLRDVGVITSQDEILRSIQGPMQTAAEDEQI